MLIPCQEPPSALKENGGASLVPMRRRLAGALSRGRVWCRDGGKSHGDAGCQKSRRRPVGAVAGGRSSHG